jgi:hypothetical protein
MGCQRREEMVPRATILRTELKRDQIFFPCLSLQIADSLLLRDLLFLQLADEDPLPIVP